MPQWEEITAVYTSVRLTVEIGIAAMFEVVNNIAGQFSLFLTAMAAIYIALMGYALLSGMLSMSMREVTTRLSKVVLVLVLLEVFTNFGFGLYDTVWRVPEAIAAFIAGQLNILVAIPGLSVDIAGVSLIDEFDILMNAYSALATEISSEVSGEPGSATNSLGLVTWFIIMAPMFMTTISIFLAKMISAVLFIIAPVVFGLSLLGLNNTFLATWFRSILVTFLTVIIVFVIGSVGLAIVMLEMAQLILTEGRGSFISSAIGTALGANTTAWTIPAIAPTGILALFALMLVTQSSSLASAIIGTAAINGQQATSFIQIGAIQAASRADNNSGANSGAAAAGTTN